MKDIIEKGIKEYNYALKLLNKPTINLEFLGVWNEEEIEECLKEQSKAPFILYTELKINGTTVFQILRQFDCNKQEGY